MAEMTIGERSSKLGIPPVIRAFMHVAFLRRLDMARTEEERQAFIAEFLAIRSELEARRYVAKVKVEAAIQDRLARNARKRRAGWPGY